MNKGLNSRQQAFVDYYLTYWDIRKAAVAAGYPPTQGTRLRNLPSIQEAIIARLEERRITSNEVLDKLSQFVRSSLRDAISVDADGKWWIDIPKAIENGSIDLIQELDQKKGGMVKLKKVDALKALIQVARILGLDGGESSEDERAWYEAIPEADE